MMTGRQFWPDALRAFSISLVLFSHFLYFWPGFLETTAALIGLLGVEIFFSLSGFLIGRILLDLEKEGLSARGVGRFWVRRWLRTLPAYYTVITLLALIAPRFDPLSYLFLQYFEPDQHGVLAVSWSLAMEEFFYLLFPPAMGLVALLPRRISPTLGAALLMAAGLTGLRLGLLLTHADLRDPSFHSHPFLRLDCCAYGVIAAWMADRGLKVGKGGRIAALAIFALACGLMEVLWKSAFGQMPPGWSLGFLWGPGMWAAFHDIVAIPAAFLLFAFAPRKGPRHSSAVTGLSRLSYGLYLVHLPIIFGIAGLNLPLPAAAKMAMALAASFAAASALHLLVEKPALAFRDRRFPQGIRPPTRSIP